MITLLGTAFLTSGNTDITTVVVKVNNEYDIKYYYLGIKDYSDEQSDIKRTIQHGNTMHPEAGEAIIQHCGNTCFKQYKDGNSINLRAK